MDAERAAVRARIPLGLVGMIALVVLVETRLGRSGRLANDMAESWHLKAGAAAREAPRSDILCFGDSQVEFGVVAPILEERLGAKVYNLALHAGTPSASYFLLKRALDAGARPKAVVVDFSQIQLVPNPLHDLNRRRAWPELATLGEALDLWWNSGDGDLFGSIVLGRLLTSLRARHEIREAISEDLAGEWRSFRQLSFVAAGLRNMKINRGTLLLPDGHRGPDPMPHNPDLTEPMYDGVRFAYMRRFLDLAASRGIPVYWVIMPISPEYQAVAEAHGGDVAYMGLVRAVAAEYPNIVAVDGRRPPGFEAMRFLDAVHLGGAAAVSLTYDLAELMLRPGAIPAPRIAAIGPYRDHPAAKRLENQAESRDLVDAAIARMSTPTAVR